MIARILKFVVKTVITLMVVAVLVAGAVGFALARWTAPAAPVPAVVAPAAPAVQWGFTFSAGSPTLPAAAPAASVPPMPSVPPVLSASTPAQTGQQVLLTGVWDVCCTPAESWPVVLEIQNGNLFAIEYRVEGGVGITYKDFVAGPGVVDIIYAHSAWEPNQGGLWTPVLTVFYEDGNGVQVSEFNTRKMFGR